MRLPRGAIALSACVACACAKEERAAPDAAIEASAARVEESPRPGAGCARSGVSSVDAVERDGSCLVDAPDPRDAQSVLRSLSMKARLDSAAVVPGGTTNLRVTITNRASRELPVVLEARPPNAGGRPDWSRLAGVPAPQGAASEAYRVAFAVRTLDARDLAVDRLPVVPPSTDPPVRYVRVRLAPGASLTWVTQWWALGIPAPYPPFKDDAGHRIVPQTAPRPLAPGEYSVKVDVPLHGVAPNERVVMATARVEADEAR